MKRPVAHEMAIKLLELNPEAHTRTLAVLYREGTVVPVKDIPKLIKAFKKAAPKATIGRPIIRKVIPVIKEAVEALEEQAKEAEKKKLKRKSK